MFLIFPVLYKNQCFPYVSCLTLLLVRYFELFLIPQFCEFGLLKSTTQWNLQNNYYTNLFWFQFKLMCTLFVDKNTYNTLWGNDFSKKKFLILKIFSKDDNYCVFKIWLFWTAVIGSSTIFNGHPLQLQQHIPECVR